MSVRDVVQAAAGALGGEALYVEDVFSTYLYTGNGSTNTITNGIDLAGEGGLTWFKTRADTEYHTLFDTERGTSSALYTNATNAAGTPTNGVTSFNSDGFTLGSLGAVNGTYGIASWTFRKAPKFFDVVTYTGSGAETPVSHGLDSVPGCIIIKRTDTTGDWYVGHRGSGSYYLSEQLVLNSTAAGTTNAVFGASWSSTTFTPAGPADTASATYVAYLFAHNAGGFGDDGTEDVISCGNFGVSSSSDGVVNLGWEPQFVIIKQATTGGSGNWYMFDNMRGIPTGGNDYKVYSNLSNAETFGSDIIDLSATGFTIKAGSVQSGTNYVYIAIRRGPMAVPTLGTEVLNINATTATTNTVTTTNFPVDLQIGKWRTGSDAGQDWSFIDRLRGLNTIGAETYVPSLRSTNTNAESTSLLGFNFDNLGYKLGSYYNNLSKVFYSLRRAPGFFDVVAYTGNGTAGRTVAHNLGVAPELIIVKKRSSSTDSHWTVYNPLTISTTNVLYLHLNSALTSNAAVLFGNGTSVVEPTSTDFTLGAFSYTNNSGDTYIAYLFATLAGVSKVGSYTGTAADVNVDCGFSSGARFVLIKRTDSTGDWYLYDSTRGIVAGNDPYLLLNSTAAQNTSTDYIDPLSSGFTVTSSAPAALNASGGAYIYLAIA